MFIFPKSAATAPSLPAVAMHSNSPRFDYDPVARLLTVRMPSPIHDFFANFVADEIHDRLKRIGERDDDAGKFASQIANGGSSRIELKEGLGGETDARDFIPMTRQPDGQFQHCRAAYPGVVLEVSYTQDGKNLENLAWDYIQYSNGDVKAVIGIDIKYGSKESTVSLWRPFYVQEDSEEVETLSVKADFRCQVSQPLAFQTENQPLYSHFDPLMVLFPTNHSVSNCHYAISPPTRYHPSWSQCRLAYHIHDLANCLIEPSKYIEQGNPGMASRVSNQHVRQRNANDRRPQLIGSLLQTRQSAANKRCK